MTEEAKNILIGMFIIVACTIFVYVLLFLHPSTGDAAKIVRVRFANINKVSVGTRVTLAGRPIGEVIKISTVQQARTDRELDRGPVYLYELTLGIDSYAIIYDSDRIAIHTAGLLGERSIAIIPQRRTNGVPSREIGANDILYAQDDNSVEETISGIGALTKKAEKTLEGVIDLMDNNNEDLNRTLKSFHNSLGQLEQTLKRANDLEMIDSIDEAFQNVSKTADQFYAQLKIMNQHGLWENTSALAENLQDITKAMNQPETISNIVYRLDELSEGLVRLEDLVTSSWGKVDRTLDDFSLAAENTRKISEDSISIADQLRQTSEAIGKGEGTLGKIVADEGLYLRGVSILNKIETLMDDVNHYGLLFHLDRGWQRQRTKKMNELHELKTASEFRNYFEEEIDLITTALSRVTMLMQHAQTQHVDNELMENRDFTKVFADLLRKVEGLEASLKLYNQRLIQSEG